MRRSSCILLAGVLTVHAAAQTRLWVSQFGTVAMDSAEALCPDGQGGAFVAGSTGGALAGPGSGQFDAWIARHDSSGASMWTRQFGSSGEDRTFALCPDGDGGAFVAGSTYGVVVGANLGSADAWMARYDRSGNRVWIRQFGTDQYDDALALCSDGQGGAYVAGATNGSFGGPSGGDSDAWLARVDGAGQVVWVRQFGDWRIDVFAALCPDGAGGAFVAGTTSILSDPPWGPAYGDALIARYDDAGNRLWSRESLLGPHDWAAALCPDGQGGAFAAGGTQQSIGPSTFGEQDAWLARFDESGNQTWRRQFAYSDNESASALCQDGAGGTIVAGFTQWSVGGPPAGNGDAWLARHNAAGDRVWVRQLGSDQGDSAHALSSDESHGAFIAGLTFGGLSAPNAGEGDAWMARYGGSACLPDLTTTAIAGSTGYGTPNGVLDRDDFFYFIALFAAGNLAVADLTTTAVPGAPGYGVPNGVLNSGDFFYYLTLYAAGC